MKRPFSLLISLFFAITVLLPTSAAATQTEPVQRLAAEETQDYGLPYYIMVNRRMNTVTVYTVGEDGYYSVPYKAMICSTARAGHNTPLGTFMVQNSRYEWRYMLDGSYGQYATRFYGNYLFHSICYSNSEPDTLLTEEYNSLGGPASMGCVRLQTIDAKWIYDNCAAGTMVTIYESDDPGPLGKPERLVDQITPELDNGWDPTDPREDNPWRSMLVSEIILPEEPLSLPVGEVGTIQPVFAPSTAVYPSTVTWHSSDPTVAVVDESGTIIAHHAGTTTITVTCGSLSASTTVTVTGQALPFCDVEPGSWYYSAVRFAYEHGFLSGTGEGQLSPHNSVTQAQLAQILYSIAGTPSIPWYYPEFTDVAEGAWYENAARWSHYHNIFTCRSEGRFEPNRPVTREEVVTALYNCVTAFYKEEPVSSQPLDSFDDAYYIFPEGLPAMRWAVEHGYMVGIENKLLPQDGITRAQLAVILQEFWSDLPIAQPQLS